MLQRQCDSNVIILMSDAAMYVCDFLTYKLLFGERDAEKTEHQMQRIRKLAAAYNLSGKRMVVKREESE